MVISFHSPLPISQSGVADFSAELLPYISRNIPVDVYTDPGNVIPQQDKYQQLHIFPYHEFAKRKKMYNLDFYQLGCGGSHIGPYQNLLMKPGVSVLHDLNLSGIFGALYFGNGKPGLFLLSLIHNQGIGSFIRASWKFLTTKRMPDRHEYWMNKRVIEQSLGIIVHTRWAKNYIKTRHQKTRIWQINLGVPIDPLVSPDTRQVIRNNLGLVSYPYVIGVFGVVDENKGFSSITDAFSQVLVHLPFALLVFVGHFEEQHIQYVQRLGLKDNVHFTGRVELVDFYNYMFAVDCVVALRHTTHGEMSGPLLRAMSLGKSVAISDHAQFSEFPDHVCSKIPLNGEVEALKQWMISQWKDSPRREAIGLNARKYIEATHNFELTTEGYLTVIRELQGSNIANDTL